MNHSAGQARCRVGRRRLLLASLGAAARPAQATAAEPEAQRLRAPAPGDLLVQGAGTAARVVTSADLREGAAPLRAWPMQPDLRLIRDSTRFNQILLLRVAVEGRSSVVAFSAICTHASCTVSGWNPAACSLVCPCHGSAFAAQRDGAVLHGPASRPLPALPLKILDGALEVASTFTSRVGGDTSRTM